MLESDGLRCLDRTLTSSSSWRRWRVMPMGFPTWPGAPMTRIWSRAAQTTAPSSGCGTCRWASRPLRFLPAARLGSCLTRRSVPPDRGTENQNEPVPRGQPDQRGLESRRQAFRYRRSERPVLPVCKCSRVSLANEWQLPFYFVLGRVLTFGTNCIYLYNAQCTFFFKSI